jgi:cellulose synthase/poly-beta-1,6-N-acetylglucosamine synthase-like glycosyltransferase
MVSNLLKVWLMNVSLGRSPEIDVTLEEVEAISEAALPIFTILVPMYREANVLPLLLDGLRRLDYPAGKLDVKLVLEPDDEETQLAVRAERLPSYVEILVVPEGLPKGKPKACNYGLVHARGEYVVIYDAEDRPERDQLRKVVAAFRKAPPELVCIQAKLNYFNRRQNVLTRWFTAEYSLWFDLLLPSIYSLSGPVPLGGTSNHFITDRLRAAGAWDPYNVTEDADLGLRIHKRGWSTAIVNSTTYEEANSDVYNWIRQRSRWVKGYIQTWLVHMRHPVKLWRQLGWRGFLIFQVMIGGTVFSFLVNPIYWALTTIWFLFHVTFVQDIFPPVLFYIGAAGLYVGNFAFTFASLGGCLRRGYYDEVKYALLTPAYWFLMSVAAWKGFIQLFYRPFYWEKTIHGLSLGSEVEPD